MSMIAGTWDDNGGKPSGYMQKLYTHMCRIGFVQYFKNGGQWDSLQDQLDLVLQGEKEPVIMWFPDVPNSKQKIISKIKKEHPKTILVSSKNNDGNKYDFQHLMAHALRNKANLFVEFCRRDDGIIEASVYDPLGNVFCKKETDIYTVAKALVDRVRYLKNEVTRIGSNRIGKSVPFTATSDEHKEFMEIVKGYADTFHELIHGANPSRFMGNCSFRCTMGGFPSFRLGDFVYVSKRNLDKREIGNNGFVAVDPVTMSDYLRGNVEVNYYGDCKPSVDTPIQLALYALYPKINFMIHAHTYIQEAPFTENRIPCGAMEEVKDILEVQEDCSVDKFFVNLKGHGSIAASREVKHLRELPYIEKGFPEIDFIEDGFGSAWSAWCPACGQKTMEVVRPGKVQCGDCG